MDEAEHHVRQGARPKSVRTTALPNVHAEPDDLIESSRTNVREPNRFTLTSTPYHANTSGHNFPLMNENHITTRRSENIARSDKRKTDIVKPDKFDGSASWIDFKSHFEVCAELNKWTFTEKGMYLAVALRGQAQSVLGNLPVGDRCNYRLLSNALEESFFAAQPNGTVPGAVAGTETEGIRILARAWSGLTSISKLGLSNSSYRSERNTCERAIHRCTKGK